MAEASASLEQKLAHVFDEVTPEEQQVLATVLILAATAPDPSRGEVEGFDSRFGIVMNVNVVGEDKLDQLDLQSLLSNYNRAQTILGNILKSKHDTVKSIISNIH